MPANTSLKKYLNNLRRILVLAFLSTFIFLVVYFFHSYFKIKEIKIIDGQENTLGLNEIYSENIIFFNDKKIEELLNKKNPLIKNIIIQKKYPSTIVLQLSYFKPIAELLVNGGVYGLSDNGKIIYKARQKNAKFTQINFYQKLNYQNNNQGDLISFKEITDGLYFLKSFNDLGLKVNSLDINGINMLLFNLENKKIILSSEKTKELQIFQLGEIVRQFKIEGKQYQEIDLRYDKPVIRF